MTEITAVRLKNGSEEAASLVGIIMKHLNQLVVSDPISLVELVSKCRDRHHSFWADSGDKLDKLRLVQRILGDGGSPEYRVHDCIRNVVLSAVTGDGLNISLGSPAAETKQDEPVIQ